MRQPVYVPFCISTLPEHLCNLPVCTCTGAKCVASHWQAAATTAVASVLIVASVKFATCLRWVTDVGTCLIELQNRVIALHFAAIVVKLFTIIECSVFIGQLQVHYGLCCVYQRQQWKVQTSVYLR